MKLEYPYTLEHGKDGRYVVQFADFEEAFTEGETLEEASFNAQEVLSLVIEQRMEDGKDVPVPSRKGDRFAVPDATVQAALLLRLTRTGNKQTVADVARAMSTSWPAVQRLEKPRHSVSLVQLEKAAFALGHQLVISMQKVDTTDYETKVVGRSRKSDVEMVRIETGRAHVSRDGVVSRTGTRASATGMFVPITETSRRPTTQREHIPRSAQSDVGRSKRK